MKTPQETLKIYDLELSNRLFIGSAGYPSPAILKQALIASQSQMITVSVRREAGLHQEGQSFWQLIQDIVAQNNAYLLPNTAGCRTVDEAINTAYMARELFNTPRIKLEVIGNEETLQPDVFALVDAAKILTREGFQVFPYTTEDLIVAKKLVDAGCEVLMPWGAPIGSGQGLQNPKALQTMRAYFQNIPLVVDAGIGKPSHACLAMELGFDAVLLNTAVAKSGDPILMAKAFSQAVQAGRNAYNAIPILEQEMASPSTPVIGTPFWEWH